MHSFSRAAMLFLLSGAGAGYVPRCPGTAGTLVAVPLSLALNRFASSHFLPAVFIVLGSISCAIWLSACGVRMLKQKDPPCIVIDEIVGFLIANFLAPPRLTLLLWNFLLFRFFDIIKPFPIRRMERLPDGTGVVLDDVLASLYTLVSWRMLQHWV